MQDRLKAAIEYLRSEMAKGFYAPDKEYLETVIYFAEASEKQKLSNTEILMFVTGWQGGTIHQLAEHLGVTVMDIAAAEYDRMQDLMRLAQSKRAALQNAPEVVTFEQFKEECRDCFIYSNVKSIAKMMQRLYPNGVRIVDEVK